MVKICKMFRKVELPFGFTELMHINYVLPTLFNWKGGLLIIKVLSLRSNLSLYALLYDARVVSLQTTFFPSPADSLLFSTYKGSSERRSGKPGMTFHLGRSCGSLLVFVCLFL